MNFLKKFSPRSFDWVLLTAAFLLVAIGLAAIYSVDLSHGVNLTDFKKQLLASGLGVTVLIVASVTQYTWFRSYAKVLYGGCLALLALVLIFGTTIRGTRGWFTVPGFSFQPVELAKIGLIMMLGYIVYHFGRRFDRPLFFFGTGIITLVIIGLIMLQPDLGSSVIIGLIWFGIMLLVGVRARYVAGFVIVAVVGGLLAWFFLLQPYQKERVLTFVYPERDALGAGYNSTQAIIAVGAGKFFGRGLGFGSQSQLRFLPEAQTDFIFSVIGEELGFAGVSLLLILYGLLLWRLLFIVRNAKDDFVSVTVSGIAILFFSQLVVNVGANLGLLPITGVTLPFVSYGGSSLMVNLFLIGVAEAMVVKKY
ncbi:MAG: rod shape-determining protein RodA [Candidatus Magasanikbacteria bacterium]|nr:rod shape-determining protein RodA [Candidatus Magasanikbacteria bacterium]